MADPSIPAVQTQDTPAARIRRWSAPECPFGIDYPAEVLEAMRRRAVEAFHALPHGGLEIGGLLFGRVSPNARTPLRIEIAAERPIETAHSNGPAFDLSEAEREGISAQLARSRLDPEIAGLSVVGFWVSHGRGELALSDADREVYKLFPHSWQIALILKPEAGAPTRGLFAFRAETRIRTAEPKHAFYADHNLADTPVATGEEPAPAIASKYQPISRDRRTLAAFGPHLGTNAKAARGERKIALRLAVISVIAAFLLGALISYLVFARITPPQTAPKVDTRR